MADSARVAQPIRSQHLHWYASRILLMVNGRLKRFVILNAQELPAMLVNTYADCRLYLSILTEFVLVLNILHHRQDLCTPGPGCSKDG